jgi:hypothetical protein
MTAATVGVDQFGSSAAERKWAMRSPFESRRPVIEASPGSRDSRTTRRSTATAPVV